VRSTLTVPAGNLVASAAVKAAENAAGVASKGMLSISSGVPEASYVREKVPEIVLPSWIVSGVAEWVGV
jgi:hypothetical protein